MAAGFSIKLALSGESGPYTYQTHPIQFRAQSIIYSIFDVILLKSFNDDATWILRWFHTVNWINEIQYEKSLVRIQSIIIIIIISVWNTRYLYLWTAPLPIQCSKHILFLLSIFRNAHFVGNKSILFINVKWKLGTQVNSMLKLSFITGIWISS